ncbi:MAG: DNA repair protein RecO [Lachnospiraceae bacterium]|jgi:DNA repair protein RecO (recombination protein O)|nr:DNA repair protein RecO [Lachnospiraceae bacterium]
MGQKIVLTGMVLSAMPVGEYDRRITLLTKERGKIAAFARGARRPGSQLMAAGPFSFGQFEAYEGRSSYTVSRAEISHYFRELAAGLEGACYGFYFLEMADYYARENADEIHMLKLLYRSLQALESGKFDYCLVRRVFELRAMSINGEGPNVFSCLKCGKEEGLRWLHVESGGAFCESCGKERLFHPPGKGRQASAPDARASGEAFRLEGSVLYAMQYIQSASIEKLYCFALSPPVLTLLGEIVDAYARRYIGKEFHALQLLAENGEAALPMGRPGAE